MAYERKVGRKLKRMIGEGEFPEETELLSSQWFRFRDKNGGGLAQTDHLLVMPEVVLIVECKNTQSAQAEDQLLKLYLPLVRWVFERPALCLQVCRNIHYIPKRMVKCPTELLARPRMGMWTWHYLGR